MKRSHWLARLVALLSAVLTACGPTVSRPLPTATATDALGVTVTLAARQGLPQTAPAPRPLPPPTPLPTPTPMIYVVQAGDTLLAIAMKYGVSLAALQAANGNVQPEFLQIGQELIIPPPGGDDGTAVLGGDAGLILPTPTPASVLIVGSGFHQTPTGGLWVLGDVFNPTADAITHVQLLVVLVGPNGERLGEALIFPALEVITPGGQAPFGVLFPATPDGMANFHVDVISAETYAHDGPFVTGVAVTDNAGGWAGGLFRVTGTVRNGSAVPVAAEVVVTLYDEHGLVIGFERQPSGTLGPGAEGLFDARVTPAGAGTVRYVVTAQGTKV